MKLLKILYVSFLCIAAATAMERPDNDSIYQEYLADISNSDLQLSENMADEYLNIFDTKNSLATPQEISDRAIVNVNTDKQSQNSFVFHTCDICPRVFKSQNALHIHKSKVHKHTKDKNAKVKFICTKNLPDGTKCGSTFTLKYNLTHHQKYAQKHRQTINLNEAALLNNIITQTSITASPAPLNEEQAMLLTTDLENEFPQSDTIDKQYLADNSHPDFQLSEDTPGEPLNLFDASENSPITQQETSGPDATIVEKDDSKETVTDKGKQYSIVNRQQCPACDKLFATEPGLKRHITRSHTEKEKQCPYSDCYNVCASDITLQNHIKKCHVHKQCPACDKLFATELGLKQHITQSHTEKEKQCPYSDCSNVYASDSGLWNHIKKYHAAQNKPCPHCDTLFATELGLKKHITQSHTEKEKQCPYSDCRNVYASDSGLLKHIKKCHAVQNKQYPQCDKLFATEFGLNQHQTKSHPEIVDQPDPKRQKTQ